MHARPKSESLYLVQLTVGGNMIGLLVLHNLHIGSFYVPTALRTCKSEPAACHLLPKRELRLLIMTSTLHAI